MKNIKRIIAPLLSAAMLTQLPAMQTSADTAKNWEYYCSLSNTEVLQEYFDYCDSIGLQLEEEVVEDGLITGGFVYKRKAGYACGRLYFRSFTLSSADPELYKFGGREPEYFGFTEDCFCNVSLGSCIYIDDERARSNSFYDELRRELTLRHSQFFAEHCYDDTVFQPEDEIGGWRYTYTEGDANLDCKVNIADAVTVLQYLANSEKYPMYKAGAECADIDGSPGLTGEDAARIQYNDALNWDK